MRRIAIALALTAALLAACGGDDESAATPEATQAPASDSGGGATVDTIVAAGGRAVVIDLKDDVGSAKAAQHGSSVRFVKGDVTREDHVQAAIDTATREFGQLDGLVNAAGIPAAERVLGKEGIQPLDHFTRVIHVNLVGTFNAIRLAGAAMATNTPSDGGERGLRDPAAAGPLRRSRLAARTAPSGRTVDR